MNALRYFGIGANRILAKDCHVSGTVTYVGRSYLYVVKKPVRLYVHEGNTRFYRCPQKGETIEVYYDPEKPENYAFYSFGPAPNPIGW